MMEFTGTGVALVTPFKMDYSVDFEALDRVVDHVIEGGVEFLVALGTTGESATLSADEKKQLVKRIVSRADGKLPVVVGIGGNNTAAVTDTIKSTDFQGIAGILSAAPHYNKPTQEGMYRHFSEIARHSPRPVILYNVPGRTCSNLSAETVLRLANEHDNIVAVKEASGNLGQIMQILKNKPSHFNVLSGDDALTLPMVHLGGKGVISVIANSHPRDYSDMVRSALKRDCGKANELHYQLLDIIGALFEEGSPAGIKAALEILGLTSDVVRLPLVPASDNLKDKIRKLMT
ncbi:MAG: 4-hydroxy-tetrahydrodipicolinate synthase [Bacteroidales bacterium]|nr:4-hydroxy-tetrahydrodipicolinate synthase [Bacteroidales bacterium]